MREYEYCECGQEAAIHILTKKCMICGLLRGYNMTSTNITEKFMLIKDSSKKVWHIVEHATIKEHNTKNTEIRTLCKQNIEGNYIHLPMRFQSQMPVCKKCQRMLSK